MDRKWLLFWGVIVIKIIDLVWRGFPHFQKTGQWYLGGMTDTESYIAPLENFLEKGNYTPDYRLPGMAVAYLPFRLLGLSQKDALSAVVIFQVIYSGVAAYFLGYLLFLLFNRFSLFVLGSMFYLLNPILRKWEMYVLTETLCVNTLSIALFLIVFICHKSSVYKQVYLAFLCGLLITWAFFLRPVVLPLVFLFTVYLYVQRRYKCIVFLLLPYFFFHGLWIVRNYSKYRRFIPLTKTIYYPQYHRTYYAALFRFLQAYGDFTNLWKVTHFFSSAEKDTTGSTFPSYIYTSVFNYDSLVALRSIVYRWEKDSTLTPQQKKQLLSYIKRKFNLYANSIKKEKPFVYYFIAPLRSLFFIYYTEWKTFYEAFVKSEGFPKWIYLGYAIIFVLFISSAFIGVVLMFVSGLRNRNFTYLFIALTAIYLLSVYGLVFRLSEHRYLVTAVPLAIITAFYCWVFLYVKIRSFYTTIGSG